MKRPKIISDQRENAVATGAAAAAHSSRPGPGAADAARSGGPAEQPVDAAADETGALAYLNFLSSPILTLDGNKTDPKEVAALPPENLPLGNMDLGAITIANLYKTNEKNPEITKQETDDAGCIVYHDGLPIYIAADGGFDCCEAENVHDITTRIIPDIIVSYISHLSAAPDDAGRRNILETIFKEIGNKVSDEYSDAVNTASFVFSAAITYEEKSTRETKLICFGNGDVLVALRRANGTVSVEKPAQRLVHDNTPSRQFLDRYNVDDTIPVPLGHHKQFLPVERRGTLDGLAKQIFYSTAVTVQPGDKIILATDALIDTAPCKIKKQTRIDGAVLVDLEPAKLSIFGGDPKHVLSVCKSNRDIQLRSLSQASNDGSLTEYQQQYAQANGLVNRFTPDRARAGDDFLCVEGIIPTAWQRKLIKHHEEHHTSLKDAHGKIKTMFIDEVLGIKNNLQLTTVQKIQELHKLLISAKDNYYLRSEMGFFGKGFFSNTGNTKSYQAVVGEIKDATKTVLKKAANNVDDAFSQEFLNDAKEILSAQRSRVQFFSGTKSLDDADADLKILEDRINRKPASGLR